MGFNDMLNYVVYDNPVSKTAVSLSKSTLSLVSGNKTSAIPSVTVITEKTPLWKMAAEGGPFIKIAGIMGASAVALGAYGAHKKYPKDKVNELKPIYETASRYHFFHTLALLAVPMTRYPSVTGSLLITGTILFSGACYYHAFTGENKLGKMAPIGGTLLIFGWLSMVNDLIYVCGAYTKM
ncbi:transmembrane protein 256 homolog [Leptinotarsa decemlineata]|uniref:transmembrane protein 256 homolog n=1 Tax=Leptinotarsa decemlineata TaxID=7539 RepID=UPI003D307D8A